MFGLQSFFTFSINEFPVNAVLGCFMLQIVANVCEFLGIFDLLI